MKKWNIYIALLCTFLFAVACKEKEDSLVALSISKELVTLGEHGGTEEIQIVSESEWSASSNQPWVRLSPINGIGDTPCTVLVDSSLVSDIREAKIVIRNRAGEVKNIKIEQFGYEKVIALNVKEVEVESMGKFGSRYFDVAVTTNTLFDIEIPEEGDWIFYDEKQLEIDLDRGERPRTVNFRFEWKLNTKEQVRVADILFKGKAEHSEVESQLRVTQEAAPTITDDRAGDSLAYVLIYNRLSYYSLVDVTEPMTNWQFVKLWERGDKTRDGELIPAEWVGRIRYVQFYMNTSEEDIPFEVSKFKCAEHISFFGNSNSYRYSLGTGEGFNELENLRVLEIAFSLVSLSENFKLKGLEELDLWGNNFNEIPETLTPENFPSLKKLMLSNNRRGSFYDLSTNDPTDNQGLYLNLSDEKYLSQFVRLLTWEKLENLELNVNFIEGELPTDEYLLANGFRTYRAADVIDNDTIRDALSKGLLELPRVLPNARKLKISLNMLTGELPNWVLYHPYLSFFEPETFVFEQETNGFNSKGEAAGFNNVPANLDYFYNWYPKRKTTNN